MFRVPKTSSLRSMRESVLVNRAHIIKADLSGFPSETRKTCCSNANLPAQRSMHASPLARTSSASPLRRLGGKRMYFVITRGTRRDETKTTLHEGAVQNRAPSSKHAHTSPRRVRCATHFVKHSRRRPRNAARGSSARNTASARHTHWWSTAPQQHVAYGRRSESSWVGVSHSDDFCVTPPHDLVEPWYHK